MKSLRTAIRALQLFCDDTPEVSVSQVSRALEIPMSSASRMLAAMRAEGLLEQHPGTKTYKPGLLAFRLGSMYRASGNIQDVIRPAMLDLVHKLRHSCWLATLNGTSIVILDNVHGGYPIRFVVEPGSQLPAHSTAAGKALLARLSDTTVAELYQGSELSLRQSSGAGGIDALLRELAEIREQKWAGTNQQAVEGIKAVGISFMSPDSRRTLALSVSFPVHGVPAGTDEAVQKALLETGMAVGGQLGDPQWRTARALA